MDTLDGMEQLLRQVQKFGPTRDPRVAVVMDTSFLMLDQLPPTWNHLRDWSRKGLLLHVVVPDVVVDEVSKHFNTEKDHLARVARKRIAQIIETGGTIETISHVEPAGSQGPLGADSTTDRRLVTYALGLSREPRSVCAVIATDDGGIMLDIANLRRAGERVACITKENNREQDLAEFIWGWLARSTADDSFLRRITTSPVAR